MKPLIFAVDIVRFSLNERAALKSAMEDFFRELYDLREDDLKPHVLPTGDGAILVWHWGRDDEPRKREDLVVPQRIIVKVLTTLKMWSERADDAQMRLGIHCDSDVEHIRIADQPSFFGHGISRCVRHETAADSNQALLSDVAREYLQISPSTPGLDVGKAFTFFDKHGKKYVAHPIGLKSVSHWRLSLPSSAQESTVRAELRAKEIPVNNAFLQAASSATIVALTCKTLGAALADKKDPLHLKELRQAEICVFSLPVLTHSHPTIKNPHLVQQEWVTGVRQTVDGLLNRRKCPKLEQLDLTILSAAPSLTATVTSRTNDRGAQEAILRYHPILDGFEPRDMPTLILNKTGEDKSPLFDAFESMIENAGRNPPRLTFSLKRGKYTRTEIPAFVDHLRTVCNHSRSRLQDRLFDVKWRNADSEYGGAGSIMPETVFSRMDGHRKTNDLEVIWNGAATAHEVVLSSRGATGATLPVTGKHLMAFFVLMTWEFKTALVYKQKPGWTHDVPGGKVTETDSSGIDTVRREVFEELGLILDRQRLGDPVGAVYDHRSAKEKGMPVIAQYYHYALDPAEHKYLFGAAGTTTKGEVLVPYPLDQLLKEKLEHTAPLEAVCHASSAVINIVVARLRQQAAHERAR